MLLMDFSANKMLQVVYDKIWGMMNETKNENLRIYYLESRVGGLHVNMWEHIVVTKEVIKELDMLVKMN